MALNGSREIATTAERSRLFGGVGPTILGIARAAETLAVLAVILNIAMTFTNTILRTFADRGLLWITDVSAIEISIITFLGAPAYFRCSSGMAYTALIDQTRGMRREVLAATGLVVFLGVCVVTLFAFPPFFAGQMTQSLPVLDISSGYVGIWLGIGLVLFCVFSLEKLSHLNDRAVLSGAAIAVALGLATFALSFACSSADLDPFLPIVPALVLAFLTGVPIAGILALAGMLFFLTTGDAPMTAIPSALQYGVSNFVLLAVPFFMLAGTLMEVTGMARRMIDMVQEWVGHWSGGLLVAQIVTMYIFCGISGSKAADIATVGSVMKEPLRHYGYPPTESVAVLAASAAMGETIPPSLMLLVLGSITTLSVGSLFIAGILPAAILAATLIVAAVLRSRMNHTIGKSSFALRRAMRSTPLAIPALMVPVIVVVGIVDGIGSPTESATFAVVYGFAVALTVYRSIGWQSGWAALRDATLTAGMILLMIAAANLVSQAIVIDGLGRALTDAFRTFEDPVVFLFVSALVMIVVGFILEGIPAILIAAPILLPIAVHLGIDPLQYGIVLTMAVGIGVFLPPVGIGYYIACTIGEAPINATMWPSLIYNSFLIVGLAIVILFPAITTWLPHFFGMQ